MLFTDPMFLLLLLPLACVLFYTVTPRFGISAGFGLLLIISLLFYWAWGTEYLILLVASVTANFISACLLLRLPDESGAARRIALTLGLLYNFCTLIWFKYRFFFSALGDPKEFSLVDMAIPIGISFYTFQQAIFLVDTWNRDEAVVAYLGDMRTFWGKLRGYVHHAFFVAFFPHLVIGPIVYLREFQPQVQAPTFGRYRRRNLEVGLMLIAIGMFKKMVLADNIAVVADSVFGRAEAHEPIPAVLAWAGAAAFYLQLYFDFSGYSDMAVGTARMLGIVFPYNFFSPLKSVGIVDFYRRWHITLTRVIARFMYTPLSIAGTRFAVRHRWRKMPARILAQWLPLLINFEVIGLWHGARATFVLFGILQGIWYVTEVEVRASKPFKAWRRRTPDRVRGTMGRAIFFILMVPCFALFRSTSLSSFFHLLGQMFGGTLSPSATMQFFADFGVAKLLRPAFVVAGLLVVAAAVVTVGLLPNSIELLRNYRPGLKTYENAMYVPRLLRFAWRPNWFWAFFMALLFLACLYFIGRQPPFLYMGY